ncbi:DNA polymerase III subunit delta' [Spiroplasma alleghenense]|uniref:DNA polymerase III subunit delta n=1 Tax=Spiroplasma alleghenense TaxID=216931 RepID=A0A345Z257_9MOLU|nr:DNA polymerase III subunit delta' [Spiroplasma alleghenense]AXK50686.1 DNA polymerase III subunit delta' [Spiroplasma alleghenense]
MLAKNFLSDLIKKVNLQEIHHAFLVHSQDQELLDKTVEEMVRLIYCPQNSLPSDECSTCKRVVNKTIVDILEIGDSIGTISKDEIKNLIKKISLTSLENRGIKIYILTNAENMTNEAANSLLKILEEPPKNTFAILKTKKEANVISTIKSRCQRVTLESQILKLEENKLIDLVKSKDLVEIMLYGNSLAKLKKNELIEIVRDFYHNFAIREKAELGIFALDLIQDLEGRKPANICIENFLIKITEAI